MSLLLSHERSAPALAPLNGVRWLLAALRRVVRNPGAGQPVVIDAGAMPARLKHDIGVTCQPQLFEPNNRPRSPYEFRSADDLYRF
jgi:hypothetical protein